MQLSLGCRLHGRYIVAMQYGCFVQLRLNTSIRRRRRRPMPNIRHVTCTARSDNNKHHCSNGPASWSPVEGTEVDGNDGDGDDDSDSGDNVRRSSKPASTLRVRRRLVTRYHCTRNGTQCIACEPILAVANKLTLVPLLLDWQSWTSLNEL